jgi:hypothetical protein
MKFRFVPLLVLLLAASAGAQVTVKYTPIDVKTRTFNPKNPPPEMPRLKEGEAAVTESKFACGVQLEVQITQAPGQKPTMTIVGVSASLELGVEIWLPTDVTRKIRAHEDGHRQISETAYKRGEETAKKLGGKYIGRQLEIKSIESRDTQPVIQRAANAFCEEYLGAIEVPSQKIQQKYDELTDHGRNRLKEDEAIRQATAAVK